MSDRSKRPTLKEYGPPAPAEPPSDDARTEVWDGDKLVKPRLRAVSRKPPSGAANDTPPRAVPQVKLRPMAEVASGAHLTPPHGLGNLAPPRDPAAVRARRRGDLVVWGAVCVMIACAVALGIWFLAR